MMPFWAKKHLPSGGDYEATNDRPHSAQEKKGRGKRQALKEFVASFKQSRKRTSQSEVSFDPVN
jgi:hypothetical protein